MQQGENINKNGRGNNFKFTYKPDEMIIRTEDTYLKQVQKSEQENTIIDGIKGSTYIANWLNLPTSTIIDYMHASLLGTTKHILNIWLSLKNKKNQFYLGSQLGEIDEIILRIKYPIEFPRQQRSLVRHIKYFKASEYRTFLFYIALPVLKNFLPRIYYAHFVQYIIFMRLLCDSYCLKQ